METLHYTNQIKASASKVWNTLFDPENYKKWTSAFTAGSHAVTDWKEGSKILFLDGKGMGMIAKIEKLVPEKFMSFQMQGEIMNGVEDLTSDRVKSYAGGHENYVLEEENGITTLRVDIDVTEEYREMMEGMWPGAMAKIKELSEA